MSLFPKKVECSFNFMLAAEWSQFVDIQGQGSRFLYLSHNSYTGYN